MRVSGDEMMRVARLRVAPVPVFGTAPMKDDVRMREGRRVAEAVAAAPDVREDIVASLKERIEAGAYRVSGIEIAEMMVRRALADRVHIGDSGF
ncbi:MAG: flagellar biosynthesis anti-sigma factor FlgM [Armatimonadota bacterium]